MFWFQIVKVRVFTSQDSSLIEPKIVESEKVLDALIRALQNDKFSLQPASSAKAAQTAAAGVSLIT
jgi:hypothetical protein